MVVEVELVFGFTYSSWLRAGRGEEEGFAVTFLLDDGVQAGSLVAVLCPGVSCIGLTMAGWSPCLGKCLLWGLGELGALQGLQNIQHGQRGAGQEVGCVAADALLPGPTLWMRVDVGQVMEEVVSRAVGRQEG